MSWVRSILGPKCPYTELNIKSSLSLTKFSIPPSLRIYMTSYGFSLLTVTTHALHCHSHQTIIITQSHSSILPTCFTSSLEPASYITQNSSSKLFIPFTATFIWTCRFNLLHSAITFYHFFTVSVWVQNLLFQKILSSTLVCLCLSDWFYGSRPFTGLTCSSVLRFSSIFSVLVIPTCGRLSWPALWSTFRRTVK